MSELKVYTPKEIVMQGRHNEPIYLKSEADNVIAELKDKLRHYPMFIAMLESDKLEIARDKLKIRHHKYKRCLAMASTCRLRARWFGDNAFYKKEQWALQWHRRWLAIAEKFKEAT